MKITTSTIELLTEAAELAKQANLVGKELDEVIHMKIDEICKNPLLWRVTNRDALVRKFNRAKLVLILIKTVEENENSKEPCTRDRIE